MRYQIRLGKALFAPAYTIVVVSNNPDDITTDWSVREIELYHDADYKSCMSDDNPLVKFDCDAQDAIFNALDQWQHGRREATHAAALKIEADKLRRIAYERQVQEQFLQPLLNRLQVRS